MNKYEKGNIVRGTVTGITKYGIFISFENIYTGLLHISEISDGFVKNVNDYAKIGDEIDTKIIDIDSKNGRLKLSIKNIDGKKKKNPYKKKIVETTSGFSTLSYKLPQWIEENLKNIKNV